MENNIARDTKILGAITLFYTLIFKIQILILKEFIKNKTKDREYYKY